MFRESCVGRYGCKMFYNNWCVDLEAGNDIMKLFAEILLIATNFPTLMVPSFLYECYCDVIDFLLVGIVL